MSEQLTAYEPEDMILFAEITEKGSQVASKRLAKEKKGTYPKTGTPDDFYIWWMQYKEGKKKDKIAMCIMAYHYPMLVMHLDQCQSKYLQLKDKTESKEKEINSLKQKLLQEEEENTLLNKKMVEISNTTLKLKSKTKSQEEQVAFLKLRLLEEKEENTLLNEKMAEISTNMLKVKSRTKSQEEEISSLRQKLLQEEKETMLLNKKLTISSSDVLYLEAKTESQEEQIAFLKRRRLKKEEENTMLNEKMAEISSKTETQKKNITVLQQKVQKQESENEQLKDKISFYNTPGDAFQNSLKLPVPVTKRLQSSLPSPPEDLPDLQYDHSNYEFLMKIKKWIFKEEVTLQCVFKLVQLKCPLKAWLVVAEKFENNDLTETDFSNPVKAGRLLEKLWKCVSEALGPGTKLFEVYYHRRQEVGETFENYIQEKFKLYCSYGVDNTEPDRNNLHFLYNIIEKAEKSHQSLMLCPRSYAELLTSGMSISRMLTTAAWNNECFNCRRKGHTQAQCRRPGGGAEVGPNQCYTCGGYSHWAREC